MVYEFGYNLATTVFLFTYYSNMAMKQLARRLQPLPLYFILGLTVCLFLLELIVAHVTHSLTLLLDAYHGLCNIIVLVGCIISTTHGSGRSDRVSTSNSSHEELKSLSSFPSQPQICSSKHPGPERQLRNTFGWARVDVLVVLIACVFLCSLCFSVVIEALQTLAHISHHDEMHAPIPVMAIGVVDLLLNLLAYVLIGGYTFHQGSFLNNEEEEGVIKEGGIEEVKEKKQTMSEKHEKRQGLSGLSRDCVGSVVVIICAICVYQTESQVAKYIDPMFSILSAVLVLLLSFPFMKESFFILMQTIPDHIDIGSLCAQLVTAFPDIVNVHELHVWRLTFDKTYCTAHIIFLNPKEYSRITRDLSQFFLGKGITHVTIQPEFYKDPKKSDLMSSMDCLVQCNEDLCMERHCCASRTPSLESVHVDQGNNHKHKGSLKRKTSKGVSKPFSSEAGAVSVVATSCVLELANSVAVKTDKVEELPAAIKTDKVEEIPAAIKTDKVEEIPAAIKADKVEEISAAINTDKVEEIAAAIETHKNRSLTIQTSEVNLSKDIRSLTETIRRTSDV